MKLFTIGFTKTTAEHFFSRLQRVGVKSVVDVRLHNVSQLAGFAKRDDLAYFLRALGGIGYVHEPLLAPTQQMLDAHKKNGGSWSAYETQFRALLEDRAVQDALTPSSLDGSCLLCSEPDATHCHRRLVAEYLQTAWGGVDIFHL